MDGLRVEFGLSIPARQGVHVFLDMHQDAFSTTNGGEGIPYWVAADFQAELFFGCWDDLP